MKEKSAGGFFPSELSILLALIFFVTFEHILRDWFFV